MRRFAAALALIVCSWSAPPAGAFDIEYSIANPGLFTANQLSLLNDALGHAKAMWETVITGYQAGISVPSVPIQVLWSNSGLASASYSGSTTGGPFTVSTGGFININADQIEPFTNWQQQGANGLNFLDEILAHETGHVLGIGTLWFANGVYDGAFHYTGQYGVAAYKAEFDPTATFIPVEDSGGPGTPGAHWDQRMRSSPATDPDHGDPNNPWVLSPLVGVTDQYGRDRGLELMTGAIDPDYREPFLSRFTVESMRDMGYTVASFEDFNHDGVVDVQDRDILMANMGRTGLQIDSIRYGDADRNRVINMNDLALWRQAAGVPEPGTISLAWTVVAIALGAVFVRRPCRQRKGCIVPALILSH